MSDITQRLVHLTDGRSAIVTFQALWPVSLDVEKFANRISEFIEEIQEPLYDDMTFTRLEYRTGERSIIRIRLNYVEDKGFVVMVPEKILEKINDSSSNI